jgi:hypothetical protein
VDAHQDGRALERGERIRNIARPDGVDAPVMHQLSLIVAPAP